MKATATVTVTATLTAMARNKISYDSVMSQLALSMSLLDELPSVHEYVLRDKSLGLWQTFIDKYPMLCNLLLYYTYNNDPYQTCKTLCLFAQCISNDETVDYIRLMSYLNKHCHFINNEIYQETMQSKDSAEWTCFRQATRDN